MTGREARFYERVPGKGAGTDQTISAVRCTLCPRYCRLAPGATGVCRARRNVDGKLVYLYYGRYSSIALDPIEKKPLYHFYPGSTILSLGSIGCNLACKFCQNWEIAQSETPTREIIPETVVELALARQDNGCIGVAFTYNEPLVGYEFVLDTARAAHAAGLNNVLVTNGEINPEPLAELLPYIDALNIDVKGFTEEFYRELCGGRLAPVMEAARLAKRHSHVELTTLVIPTKNDDPKELAALVDWVADELGDDTPLHFLRYFPQYRLDLPATPLETLKMAREIALRRLKFVYIGNAWELGEADTRCLECGKMVIERRGYRVDSHLMGGHCPECGARIAEVGR